jgi:uncharacterized protein YxeA
MLLKRSTILMVLLVLLVSITAVSATAASDNSNKKSSDDLVFTPVETPEFSAATSQASAMAYSVYTISSYRRTGMASIFLQAAPGITST